MASCQRRQSRRADPPSDSRGRSEDFYDAAKLDAEMRRVFDICHGCRRCFNLCDSFPRLFDLIDSSPTEDVDGVKSEDFAPVVEACTLCDMCFMTKCPYVPPHRLQSGFPASDAAPPRGRGDARARRISPRGSSPRWTATARLAQLRRAAGQLGVGQGQQPDARRSWKSRSASTRTPSCRNSTRRTFVAQDKRAIRSRRTRTRPLSASARRRSMPPASSTTTSRRPAWQRARCSIIIGVETQRRLSRLLRHAVPGTGRTRPRRGASREGVEGALHADRPGLRHRRAHGVLRPDAEIRMAADRAGQSKT